MDVEAVVLTGGRSSRMGVDKSRLMAGRVLKALDELGMPVTVLGREPVEGRAFLPDAEDFEGPARALVGFCPSRELVFVAGCDLPLLRPEVVRHLATVLEGHDAALPNVGGHDQYLCGLYRASVFQVWKSMGARSMSELVGGLDVLRLTEGELLKAGLQPGWVMGANTPDELSRLTGGEKD